MPVVVYNNGSVRCLACDTIITMNTVRQRTRSSEYSASEYLLQVHSLGRCLKDEVDGKGISSPH